MIFVNNQPELSKVCLELANEKILYMDTEFDRRRTYYANLSLIQISSEHQKIIIDALAGLDLSEFRELLMNLNILKVFHSPDQDFDIFLKIFGELPQNIFDTQIAANVCGLDEGMGYGRLCKAMLNIEVDKSFQKANWLERPLSAQLLEYAIRDTEFLIPLHRILSETITSRKLWDSYHARSAKLLDVNSYKFSATKLLQRMRLTNKSQEFMKFMLDFISLREECAQFLNIPRSRCASDYDLVNLCGGLPATEEELKRLGLGFLPLCKGRFREKIFSLSLGIKNLS